MAPTRSTPPDRRAAEFDRAVALQNRGNLAEAVAAYDALLAQSPAHVEAQCNRASALLALGRAAEAADAFGQALALKPDLAEALTLRGVARAMLGRFADALADHERAIAIKPGLAMAHAHCGHALLALQRPAEALAALDEAVRLEPGNAGAHANRGLALQSLARPQEAVHAFDRALAIAPKLAEAWSNRGVALQAINAFDEALASLARASELAPGHAPAWVNRAYLLQAMQRPREAIADCERALAVRPGYAEAQYVMAHCMLSFGLSEPALRLYERRFEANAYRDFPDLGLPLLYDRDPRGESLLVQWEQRFGDVVQMLRYAPALEALASRCTWQVAPPLAALFRRSFPALRVIAPGERDPDARWRLPYTSLPLALRSFSDAAIPSRVPYLVADPERAAAWRHAWHSDGRSANALRVGIVWSGNDQPPNRSIAFDALSPLLALSGVRFFTLQPDLPGDDAHRLHALANVTTVGDRLASFDDTASVLSALDLVISIDTAVAHLAGALGRPLWILLKHGADARWELERSDSPWYPSARLFRQRQLRDWGPVIAEVAAELAVRRSGSHA